MASQKPRRLGEILLERGWITHEQLYRALEKQQHARGRLGTALVEIDALSEEQLQQALSEQQRVPFAGIDELRSVPPEVIALVPARIAVRCRAVPFRVALTQVHIAMMDVKNLAFQDELAFVTAKRIKIYVCSEARIFEALEKFYGHQCSSRYVQLLDRLNRARYLWDRGVEVPVTPEEPGIFVSIDQALGREPGPPARPTLAVVPPPPPTPPLPVAPEPVPRQPEPATAAPPPAPAPSAPAPPAPAAPVPPPGPDAPPPVSAYEPHFETRVGPPPGARPAPVTFGDKPGDPQDVTLIVPPPAGASKLAPPATPAPTSLTPPPAPAPAMTEGELEARLLSPKDRDDVGRTLLEYLGRKFTRVVLLVVRKQDIAGWMATGVGIDEAAVRGFQSDVAKPSVFVNLVQRGDFFLGPLPPMPVHRDLARTWGGEMPKDCMVLPIRLRGRLVAMIYLDRATQGLGDVDPDEMKRLAAKATIALELCIMRNKLRNA